MKRYPKYKDSGVKWIGEIPEHWEVKQMRNYLTLVSEKNHPEKQLLSVTREQGVIIRNSESKEENHNYVPDDLSGYKYVKEGQFVINKMKSWQGSYGVSDYEGIVSPAYYVCDLSFPCKEFFSKAVRSKAYIPFFTQYSKGIRVDQWDLSTIGLKTIPFIEPPIKEQQAIVAYLDEKVGKIDRYISEKEKEIVALDELKQATIANAVTRGLDPNAPLKDSGIKWIGNIPQHWEVKRLASVSYEHYISNKEVHHQNLLSLSYGRIIRKDINKTDGLLPSSFDTYQIVEEGNIVLRLTDLQNDHRSLRVGLVKEEGIITSAYLTLGVRDNIIPQYLYYQLHSNDIHKVFYGMGDGIRQGLNWNGMRKLPMVLPPIKEQQAIVDYINTKTAKIDQMKDGIKSEIEKLKEYKQRLISDVVTGKVCVKGEK